VVTIQLAQPHWTTLLRNRVAGHVGDCISAFGVSDCVHMCCGASARASNHSPVGVWWSGDVSAGLCALCLQKHVSHLKSWDEDEDVIVFASDAPNRRVGATEVASCSSCCYAASSSNSAVPPGLVPLFLRASAPPPSCCKCKHIHCLTHVVEGCGPNHSRSSQLG
jgi:hypothetical protein